MRHIVDILINGRSAIFHPLVMPKVYVYEIVQAPVEQSIPVVEPESQNEEIQKKKSRKIIKGDENGITERIVSADTE